MAAFILTGGTKFIGNGIPNVLAVQVYMKGEFVEGIRNGKNTMEIFEYKGQQYRATGLRDKGRPQVIVSRL